ncbi:hypothetical protein A0257_10545 [Hymenobacter psoromatis]|nr:hypothetical protein A0257_10545 [Hymenobacter psoromatis]
MFESYEADFGKVNLSWAHSVRIELEELNELLELSAQAWLCISEGGEYEITGYTKLHKFVTVTFTLTDHTVVVESVNLPSYGRIREVVINQFLAA